MRVVSFLAILLLVVSVASSAAQPKSDSKTNPKGDAKLETKPPPISSVTEIEGKTLDRWEKDLIHTDPSVQEKAISVIPAYGAAASHLVPKLVLRVKDPRSDVGPKLKAIIALGVMEIDDKDVSDVVKALAGVLEDDTSQHAMKLNAAMVLTRFGPEGRAAIGPLVGTIGDTGSWQIRKVSLMALRHIAIDASTGPDPRATSALHRTVRLDPAYQVRVEAVQALGIMGRCSNTKLHQEVIETLESLATAPDKVKDPNRVIAMSATLSLIALEKEPPGAKKQIVNALGSNDLELRGQTVLALGAFGKKAKPFVGDLLPLLDDKDYGVAVSTCWALAMIGDKNVKVMDALKKVMENDKADPRVREQARRATEELKAIEDTPPPKETTPVKGSKP
jgi:HEAT repeat protein